MKKILYVVVAALIFSSCKTNERVQDESLLSRPSATVPAPAPVAAPTPTPTPVAAPTPVEPVSVAPISTRSESVEVISSADGKDYPYYIIIGSFSSQANAQKYTEELKYKNFTSSILKSNATAYYRVSVGGFNSESNAREEIYRIRKSYPEYRDTWLLKTK